MAGMLVHILSCFEREPNILLAYFQILDNFSWYCVRTRAHVCISTFSGYVFVQKLEGRDFSHTDWDTQHNKFWGHWENISTVRMISPQIYLLLLPAEGKGATLENWIKELSG